MHPAPVYESLNRAAASLDGLRRSAFSFGAARPLLRPFVVDKELRIAGMSLGHVALALLGSLLFPSLLLVVGPLLLGVPHVVNDIRYLVLRRRAPLGFGWLVLGFSLVLLGLRLVETAFLGNPMFAFVELGLVGLWVIAAASLRSSDGPWLTPRRALGLGPALVLGALALRDPVLSRLVFAHAHNLMALVLWYCLYPGRRLVSWLPLAGILLAAAGLFFFGGSVPERFGWPEWFELHVASAAAWLAPGLPPHTGRGLVLCYTFLQSVHYAVWLVFLPKVAYTGRGTPTFSKALKSAWFDLGAAGLLVAGLGLLAVLIAGLFNPLTTSAIYLFVTPFHGYLELAVLAAWLTGTSQPRPTRDLARSA